MNEKKDKKQSLAGFTPVVRAKRSTTGFTLLEATIGIAIISIALGIFIVVFQGLYQTNHSLQYQTLAMKAGQEMMEQLKVIDYATLPAQNGLTFQVVEIPEVPGNIGAVAVTDISGGSGNVYEISVVISNTYAAPAGLPKFYTRLISRRAR